MTTRAEIAIAHLQKLKEEGSTAEVKAGGQAFHTWRAKTRGLLTTAFGEDDHVVKEFVRVKYSLSAFSTSTPRHVFDAARYRGINEACGYIEAAIFKLQYDNSKKDQIESNAYDPELWRHVERLIEDQDWEKVASSTAIYVEHTIRSWAGQPTNKKGETLVGKALMASVFADDSPWRLGNQRGEHEGWRSLAIGFTQATSNVDRHHIQQRDDAQRYAMGVLGVASLLLTQFRHTHGN